jgi:hypothetical protein
MNVNVPIHWFYPFLGKPIDSHFNYNPTELADIDRFKDFQKAIHYGDPDVRKRSMATKTLTSTRAELAEIGIYVQSKPESNQFATRREQTKVLLQHGIEVNDTPGTQKWLEAMDNARYPQRQDTSQATSPITLPIHDWTSHHRTATEYFAVNYEKPNEDVYLPTEKLFDDDGFYV